MTDLLSADFWSEVTGPAAGLLLLRLTVALLVAGHAVQKGFGWLGGDGLKKTVAVFDRIGFRPARPMVIIAVISELSAATLVALGLFTPIAAAALCGVMIVACSVHWQFGIWAAKHGYEVPLTFGLIGAALCLTGPGAWSLDRALFDLDLPAGIGPIALMVALLGAATTVMRRHRVLQLEQAPATAH